MTDYIRKDTARRIIDSPRNREQMIAMLEAVPSEDVQPVRHGHWIIKDNPGTGSYRVTCSECGEDVTSVAPVIGFFPNARVTWNFCPNCGADMRGEQSAKR